MALAETAELAVTLKLNDQFSGGVSRAKSEFAGLATGAAGVMGGLEKATSGVTGAIGHAGGQIKGLITGPLGIIGLTGGMLGLAGATKTAIDSATTFQSQMELIATQAGGTQAEVDAMTKGVLAMATAVGTAPDQLAAGLYHIESAGLRGAKALDILKIAAEGAKVGNADLESVTNALVAAVNSGIAGAGDMTQAMGTLNAIVGAGNMRMQDLTDAFSTGLLSSAKTFGVSLQSIGAAIADMTNQGVPAIDAATRLRMSLSLLAAPTSKAAKLFEGIGIGSLDLAKAMRGPGGILAAVTELRDHMVKAHMIDAQGNINSQGADFLSQAFGGGRSSSAIMTLIGSLGKLNDIQKQVTDGAGAFGDAWAKTQQDAQFKFEKFQAAIGTLAIKLGDALLPTLSDLTDAAANWLGDPTNQQSLIGGLNSAIDLAKQVGGAIKDVVIPAIKAIGSAWNAIPEPLRNLLVGGFVANKAAGWLFGTSPLSVGKNLLSGLLGGVAGRVPGVGAIIGAGVPHVWVDNMPAGGLGGGGLPINPATAAGAAGGGALLGAATLAAGIGAILAAYYLPQTLWRSKEGATPSVVQSGAMAGTVLPATGYMSIDALSQGNPALRGLIQANTGPVPVTIEDNGPVATRDNYAHDAFLAAQEKAAKPTRDLYAVEAAAAAKEAAAAVTAGRHLSTIAANTKDEVVATKAGSRSASDDYKTEAVKNAANSRSQVAATKAVHDKLVRLNADENTNATKIKTAVTTQKPPVVNTNVHVTSHVTVSDIAKNSFTAEMSAATTTIGGNRAQRA